MNLCYQIPSQVLNQGFYERLKEKFEQNYATGCVDVVQATVVPKKTARCIFVQKGKHNTSIELVQNR